MAQSSATQKLNERVEIGHPDERSVESKFIDALKDKLALLSPGESTRVGYPTDENSLRSLLHAVGFHRVRKWKPDEPEEGWTYLQASKPNLERVPGVVAVMSLPRYGLCSNFGTVTNSLGPLGIKLEQGFGVYWSEVMTDLIGRLCDREGVRYVLTIDYDSIFDSSDVLHLLHLMEENPDAGAICGVQMRRTKPTALISMEQGGGNYPIEIFEQELTQVRSAHFGLTAIRVDALRKLSKPWFQAVPDSEGGWDYRKGYIASDVNFWLKFGDQGNKLYQANYVAIGHVEEQIVWPDRYLRPVIQNMDDYRKEGIPDEVLR